MAVTSEEEALAQFFSGEQGRSTARHMLNAASSRSHALFSVALEMRTSEDAAERAVVGGQGRFGQRKEGKLACG